MNHDQIKQKEKDQITGKGGTEKGSKKGRGREDGKKKSSLTGSS